jgi:hypothetical protein
MRQVVAAAPQEPSVWEASRSPATACAAASHSPLANSKGWARSVKEIDAAAATDLLWLHLCNAAYFIRTDDLGWTLDDSETWLNEALTFALLGPVSR